MTVHVLAFAGIRDIVGRAKRELDVPDGATVGRIWDLLVAEYPLLDEVARSTRLARNGSLVERDASLRDGDELALMPPFGGG